MFGEDLVPDVFAKAATLLRSIAQNQPFADGNKRTAWLAAPIFLRRNGTDAFACADDVAAFLRTRAPI
jgi:death-on-curing protein